MTPEILLALGSLLCGLAVGAYVGFRKGWTDAFLFIYTSEVLDDENK